MRVKTLVLCSTSGLMLALAATPAAAQDQPVSQPATPPDPTVRAQDNPAAPDQGAPQTDDSTQSASGADDAAQGDTIVVTGFRRSLQSAQNIKRNSVQIVDAIVAEDIGKLPDTYVSDTAARIPGVQVERSGGEAGRVLVRGLPDFETTYNGREIFTAETRVVALQDFPAGAIGAIEVFKTSTANLIEPGLAGLVNVRSHRPFDFSGREISGSVWGVYPKVSRDLRPNGQILLSDRWSVGQGEMGALINVSYSQLHYRDSTRSNTDFVAGGPNGTRFPDVQRATFGEGIRSRPSVNGALQWRPSPGLEFYVEGLWQGFKNKLSDRELTVPLWGGASYTNIQTRPGTNLIDTGTVVNPFRPDGFQGGTLNKTNTYQLAAGGSWDSGPLRLTFDVARTKSRFHGQTESVDYAFASPQTIDFVTNVPGSDGPTFTIRNFDPANPANYVYRGFFEENQVAKGDDWQARVDAEYETGLDALPKFQVGLRYVDRDATRQFGSRYSTVNGGAALGTVPLDYVLSAPGFRTDDMRPFPDRWLAPTYSSIHQNLDQLRTFAGYPTTTPGFVPEQSVVANEKSKAAYAQLYYKLGILDGQVGVRVVETHDQLLGFQLTQPATGPNVVTAVAVDRKYTDWLPNLNANLHLTDKLQLRGAVTRTRTRPSFRDLSPSFTIDRPDACFTQPAPPPSCRLTGNSGNPFLQRLKSTNYDASLEYYFSRAGFASLALYRRDLKGFIETASNDTTAPGTTTQLRLNQPLNSGKGHIQGFEGQVQTFFDWAFVPEWARRFGVQANVTNIDAKADFTYSEPTGPGGTLVATTVNRRLLGVSKWSYNLVGMYEGGGLSLRLAYNRRSSYWTVYQRRDTGSTGSLNLYEEKVRPVSRLDLSSSYAVTSNVTLFADWTNILQQPFRSDLFRTQVATGELVSFPRAVRYEESVISAGVRFHF
jgi:iron complex outermembrane recepter protein